MICTTIQNKSHCQVLEALNECEMAEIRLDRCALTSNEIADCFSKAIPLVATCRVADLMEQHPDLTLAGAASIASTRLMDAIEAGAQYVDLEVEFPSEEANEIIDFAKNEGVFIIRSYHDFEGTASLDELTLKIAEMSQCENANYEEGAECVDNQVDIIKLVSTSNSLEDNEVIRQLYLKNISKLPLIAFSMGEIGRSTRIDALKYGAPFTYAALTDEEAAAPGQMSHTYMENLVYGDKKALHPKRNFVGENCSVLSMPASKSFAQRAILTAALAKGCSRLSGYSPCGDTDAAISVALSLGAQVKKEGDVLEITGLAAEVGSLDLTSVHTVESGLLTRLMIPLVSTISRNNVTITGEKTLAKRPLKGAETMMQAFGVQLGSEIVPIEVMGELRPGEARISGEHGSQLISGLLMSLPLFGENSNLIVENPKSIPYMFITLDVLKRFGVKVKAEMSGGEALENGDWGDCDKMEFRIRGKQTYKAADFHIEGDWSAAANFLVAGAVFGKVELKGLDFKSLQADLSIIDILTSAGAFLTFLEEDDSYMSVRRSPLNSFITDATNCPDLFPILAVLAAFCEGHSVIRGVSRLIHKESDRAEAITSMLNQMGVEAYISKDSLNIIGYSISRRLLNHKADPESPNGLLKGGNYTSSHDHRMAMALKVASLGASSPIIIDDEGCVSKSFPNFMELFNEIIR